MIRPYYDPDRPSRWKWTLLGALGGAVIARLTRRRAKKTRRPSASGPGTPLPGFATRTPTPEVHTYAHRSARSASGAAPPGSPERAEREPRDPGDLPVLTPEPALPGELRPEDLPPRAVLERGHEPESNTRVRGVVVGGAIVLATIAVALLVLAGLMRLFAHREEARAVPSPPFAAATPLPPAPQLQTDPAVDLAALRAREEHLLATYGASDSGAFRLPVARAMALLAERGLPVRPDPPVRPETLRTESGFSIILPSSRPPAPTARPQREVDAAPHVPSPRARLLLDTLQSRRLP